MNPEALTAVKSRLDRGQSDEEIKAEFLQAGYDEATIAQLLNQAKVGSDVPVPSPEPRTATLPGVFDLLRTSFNYVFSRLDLLLLLASPAFVMIVLTLFIDSTEAVQTEQRLLVSIVSVLAGLAGVIFTIASIYIVANASERHVSFSEGFAWVKKNGLSFIWIGILVAFTQMGGYILLIIPGIIVSVYLMLSHVVLAREGLRGMDALLRSRQLILGHWWGVLGRVLGVSLLFFIALFIVMVIIGMSTGGEEIEESVDGAVFGLISTLLRVVYNVAIVYVLATIYNSLKVSKPNFNRETAGSVRGKYKLLAWLGPVLIFGLIFLAVILASLNDARERGLEIQLEQTAHTESPVQHS